MTEPQVGFVPLNGISAEQVKYIRLLQDNTELSIVESWITGNYPDIVFVSLGANPALPNPTDTVIEVVLK